MSLESNAGAQPGPVCAVEPYRPAGGERAPDAARLERTRLLLVSGAIALWVVVWAAVYVGGAGNGSDFQVFYAAATADLHGINCFNWPALWGIERALYNGGGDAPFAFSPFGYPPPFALLLRPLTALREPVAYPLWAALLAGAGALGAYLAVPVWPRRARLLFAVLAAASPAALLTVRLGQASTLLLLGLGLACRLFSARRPALAGAALALGMVKPHLMVPVALITIAAAPRGQRRPALLGLLGATTMLAGLTLAADGGIAAYAHWWADTGNYVGSMRLQPDVASLPGIYFGSAPQRIIPALNLLCLGLAVAIILLLLRAAWRGGADERLRLFVGGSATYFALTPYVHSEDQVLLLVPLALLIGPDGRGLRSTAVLLATMTCIVAPMAVFRDYHTEVINALPPLTLALACTMLPHRSARKVASLPEVARRQHRGTVVH